jgi:uncharacterized membrane protein YuzA (DUF378 family)
MRAGAAANLTGRDRVKDKKTLAAVLLIAGGLNWGLIGLFGFNLVASVFGGLGRIIYIAVGWAAIYYAANWSKTTGS